MTYTPTAKSTGRRPDRLSGKSRITVRLDEWLFDWLRNEAVRSHRSLSQQCEMILSQRAQAGFDAAPSRSTFSQSDSKPFR